MKQANCSFLLLFMMFLTSCIIPESVDMIVHNANIISVNENGDVYEAMAIQDGKILELGSEHQILNKYSSDQMVDAQLATILPGFIDAHCHFLGYGITKQQVDLLGVQSMSEMIDRCQEHYNKTGSEWITGRGWDHTTWADQKFPNYDLLNEAFPDVPVLLRRIGGHAALANKKALELAGISETTTIGGGHIEVLEGKLTGIILDNAVDRVLSVIPELKDVQKKQALLRAQRDCFEYGLTTVVDAGLNKSDVLFMQRMEKEQLLQMKVYIMLSDNAENFAYFIDSLGGPFRTDLLNVGAFKFYGDGALGARSACLKRPYSDITDTLNYGFLLQNPDYFRAKAQKVYDSEFQMCTHCIGDSAARIILDIYGSVLGGVNDKRWRIEHAQVIAPEDFEKFREYTIFPSVQPTHATSDMPWAMDRLGDKRIKNSYAYKKLLQQNGVVALGTDFPIENINPIETFYAAVARKNKKGMPKNGYMIENALTRWQALKGMTIWAAMANFEENTKGSIEVGKAADFIILSQDLLLVPEDKILNTYVKSTFVNGVNVYEE